MRRHEGSGRRRIVVSSAALLLVAAVGVVAIYGSVVPAPTDRQSLPGAALAVMDQAAATTASDTGAGLAAIVDVTPVPKPVPWTNAGRGVVSTADDGTTADALDPKVTRPADPKGRGEASTSSSGWVCEGEVKLQDPRERRWSLGRAAFRAEPGYERVVLHIDRLGRSSGAPASMTAQALSTAGVRGTVPGVRTPSGPTTFSLHLAGPIEGHLGVRSYRPSGLRMLKEFSVYPAIGGSSRVLVSATSGRCFRVRVPAWTATGPNTRTAQIYLDIKS